MQAVGETDFNETVLGSDTPVIVDFWAEWCGPCRLVHPELEKISTEYEGKVKVVKVEGEFVWHTHEDTDELFLVIDGELTIQLRDGDVVLRPGQLYVVPRGVEHCPSADGEVHAVLVEPTGVVNTGDAGGPMTAQYDDSLA